MFLIGGKFFRMYKVRTVCAGWWRPLGRPPRRSSHPCVQDRVGPSGLRQVFEMRKFVSFPWVAILQRISR